jgi:hypothetical protein
LDYGGGGLPHFGLDDCILFTNLTKNNRYSPKNGLQLVRLLTTLRLRVATPGFGTGSGSLRVCHGGCHGLLLHVLSATLAATALAALLFAAMLRCALYLECHFGFSSLKYKSAYGFCRGAL